MRIILYFAYALIVFIVNSPSFALSANDLSFYASFDSSVSADLANGDVNPLDNVKTSDFEFTQGILGKAIIAGDKAKSLAYAVAANMDDKEGTLSFWIKPIDWKAGDSKQHVYMQIPGRMTFYNYWQSGTSGFYWMTGSTIIWGPGGVYGGVEQDKWHQLTVTWGSRKAAIYIDGEKASEVIDMPLEFPRWNDSGRLILADPTWTSDNTNRTAIDELMIFKRPLEPAEIKSLYRRGVATLLQPTASVPMSSNKQKLILNDFVDGLFGNLSDKCSAYLNWDANALYVMLPNNKKNTVQILQAELSLTDSTGEIHKYSISNTQDIAVKWKDLGYKKRPIEIGFDLNVRYGA